MNFDSAGIIVLIVFMALVFCRSTGVSGVGEHERGREKMTEKLIRDKMPQWIEKNQDRPDYYPIQHRIADKSEMPTLLADKLMEESEEVGVVLQDYYVNNSLHSLQKRNLIEELCDLLEVIEAICDRYAISQEEMEDAKEKKLIERGGFQQGVVLVR